MTWNYRVIRKSNFPSTDPKWVYQIYEVYYSEDKSIQTWTESAVTPTGDNLPELQEDITYFLEAINLPILKEASIHGKNTLIALTEE